MDMSRHNYDDPSILASVKEYFSFMAKVWGFIGIAVLIVLGVIKLIELLSVHQS